MKALLFAAALSIGGVAMAQDTTQTTTDQTQSGSDQTGTDQSQTGTDQPSGQTVDDPSQASGPAGVTQQGTVPDGQASAPMGTNQPVDPNAGMATPAAGQQAAFTPRAATTNYPPCSRTVTDNCVQTYERGVRHTRSRRR